MAPEVRPEAPADFSSIRLVNELAFGGSEEAALVEELRNSGVPVLSLVLEEEGRVKGHILFSPITIGNSPAGPSFVGLGPMSVLPDWQRSGLGSRLVESGLDACRRQGHRGVVVLGHPAYYPRFGFVPSSRYGLTCKWDVPDEAFMALELVSGAFDGFAGTVRYHDRFG